MTMGQSGLARSQRVFTAPEERKPRSPAEVDPADHGSQARMADYAARKPPEQ
ncbi:MAG: hypothetical protein IH996_07665 [Proteobacteria bacterium]|nr:hypothetical protein [Pseudomonadota bacterium]